MDIILKVFAGIAFVISIAMCFVGLKLVKASRAAGSFLAGASIGVVIGVALNNIIIGIISIMVLGAALAAPSIVSDKAGAFVNAAFFAAIAACILSGGNIAAVITAAVIFAVLAIFFEKTVIIGASSIAGAAAALFSAFYIIFSFDNLNDFYDKIKEINIILLIALFALISAGGIICQILTNKRIKNPANYYMQYEDYTSAQTFSERKYPGMQRAYRNFCIECGSEMLGTQSCPKCGFRFDN